MNHQTAIGKLLAGSAGADELSALDAALTADPDTAAALVQQARMHAALDARLGPARPVALIAEWRAAQRRRWTRRMAAVAAIAALAVMAGLALKSHRSGKGAASGKTDSTRDTLGTVSSARPTLATAPPTGPRTPSADNEGCIRPLLNGYFLRNDITGPGSVHAVLAHLPMHLQAVNHLKDPAVAALRFTAADEVADRPVTEAFWRRFCQGDVWSALEALAALSEARLDFPDANHVRLVPMQTSPGDQWFKAAIRVRPDFLSREIDDEVRAAVARAEQPFPGDRPAPPPALTAAEVLNRLGLSLSAVAGSARAFEPADDRLTTARDAADLWKPGPREATSERTASVAFEPSTSTLRVTADGRTLDRLERLLKLDAGRPDGATISVASRILEYEKNPSVSPGILNAEDYRRWLDALGQQRGVTVVTSPSVITKSGQRALIEELVPDVAGESSEPDWRGIRIDCDANVEGAVVRLKLTTDIQQEAQQSLGDDFSKPGSPRVPVAKVNVDSEGIVPSGHTALIPLTDGTGARHLVMAVTVTRVSADGSPR